uniref:Uncharacterized protein n=1 Tax=Leersia perrieri TaxID=77586 RepID=A0A0D9XR41_9ORYZ
MGTETYRLRYRETVMPLLSELENEEDSQTSLLLAEVTKKTLSIRNQNDDAILHQGGAKSAIDYLKARSYRGLTGEYEDPAPDSVLTGRTGRAAGHNNNKITIGVPPLPLPPLSVHPHGQHGR